MALLFSIAECASTNDEIEKFIAKNSEEKIGVFTANQTRGRGQYGNLWENFEDENLAYSFGFKSDNVFSDVMLNFYVAVILRNFIANFTADFPKIKWPNDIILNRKKVSGILIEKRKIGNFHYFIIGIGINVLQENFERFPKAGSLLSQTGKRFRIENVAEQLHEFLNRELFKTKTNSEILSEFNANLFLKNEVTTFKIKDLKQNGIIQNVDENGFLHVELEKDGLQKFFHKEIEWLY
ncbi:MAG: biotin--[acetyl-CoA-carboxylase] ligase [Flavobacteriaceae bacterium]|jgi:BirA family biotin operon repressor/biotin-[acetyl-CoA-carboxylase] ligase|nr:biotin--[acetyl-CoA-carboxylase] ligase [Flavobacteriaceae bacterium]